MKAQKTDPELNNDYRRSCASTDVLHERMRLVMVEHEKAPGRRQAGDGWWAGVAELALDKKAQIEETRRRGAVAAAAAA